MYLEGVGNAANCGYLNIVELLIDKFYGSQPIYNRIGIFRSACYSGNVDIIQFLISKEFHDYSTGLYGACEGGHMDAVLFVLNKIDVKDVNWNAAFSYACSGGNKINC